MTKAYDIQALGELILSEAKKNGLELAEECLQVLATSVYQASKTWAVESAKISDNHIDDMISPFYGYLDSLVMPQIKKINLKSA
jgi:hypothetical protein